MLNSFFEYVRQIFKLTEAQQRTQITVKELQKEVRDLSKTMEDRHRHYESAIERLAYEIQRLREEMRHALRHEADEREKFQLKIENQLLKARLSLPPSTAETTDEDGEPQ